jgi:hypothetical protein
MENNKYITKPFIPKTETRIILEQKQPTQLSKLANFLGMKKVYACNEKPCKCVEKAEVSAATAKAMSELVEEKGGKVETTVDEDGKITFTYYPLSPKKD